ncbi:MAG: DUF1552 domain-containing protein [Myxococcota bacterium]|nr:DUF1552 domain-containing protein [Myxococcota bacterium]
MGKLGRRAFLGTSAGIVAASPLLRASRVLAGGEPAPRRLVIWHVPSGTVELEFRPRAGATQRDFTLPRILQPLERHRDRLLVFGPSEPRDRDGTDPYTDPRAFSWRERKGISLHVPGDNGHRLTKILTGMPEVTVDGRSWGGGPSIDQVVAQRIGDATPFRSLELAVHDGYAGSGSSARMIYSASGVPVPPTHDPRAAFDRLFGGRSAEPDPGIERARRRRRAMLDLGRAELERSSGSLGAPERRLLDAHATALEELDRRLDTLPGATCTFPARLDDGAVARPSYDVAPREVYRAQVEILAHALGCDLTRVGSLSFGRSDSHTKMPWLGGLAATESHHGLSHTSPWEILPGGDAHAHAKLQALVDVHRFYMDELAHFMDLLAAMPEGEGTVLDNTLIFVVNEISEGQFHTGENMPWLLAGGSGSAMRMGRYVQYGDESHNRLLLSIAHAMGLTDLTTFGDPAHCSGPLSDLA